MADDQRPDPMQSFYEPSAPRSTASASASAGRRRVFRNQETRFIAGAFGALSLAFAIIFPLFSGPTTFRVGAFLFFMGIAVAIYTRWMRQGIYVDEAGVEVRGGFTTRRVAWVQIDRFELRRGLRDMVTWVVLLDGNTVRANALHAGTGRLAGMRRRAQEQLDELNRLLVERRSGTINHPGPSSFPIGR